MSGLLSMLVPLETLPGWPAAPNPSVLEGLLVLLGIPLLIAAVISAWSFLGSTRELKRFGPPVNPHTALASAPTAETTAGEEQTRIEAKPGADAGTGGASARW